MRVLIAEDHAFTLEGMQHALCASGFIEVCAVARGGIPAIALARLHNPDVAVLDFAMPDATGLEVHAEIARWSPATRCIILTGNTSPDLLAQILAAGVCGLFTKACATAEVIAGIRRVARGERVVAEAAAKLLQGAGASSPKLLTGRERQVLQGIARGLTNAAIAETLGISPKTVDSHRMSMMRKLQVNSAPALVIAAVRRGLIDP